MLFSGRERHGPAARKLPPNTRTLAATASRRPARARAPAPTLALARVRARAPALAPPNRTATLRTTIAHLAAAIRRGPIVFFSVKKTFKFLRNYLVV